jgi:hypothetical protein
MTAENIDPNCVKTITVEAKNVHVADADTSGQYSLKLCLKHAQTLGVDRATGIKSA